MLTNVVTSGNVFDLAEKHRHIAFLLCETGFKATPFLKKVVDRGWRELAEVRKMHKGNVLRHGKEHDTWQFYGLVCLNADGIDPGKDLANTLAGCLWHVKVPYGDSLALVLEANLEDTVNLLNLAPILDAISRSPIPIKVYMLQQRALPKKTGKIQGSADALSDDRTLIKDVMKLFEPKVNDLLRKRSFKVSATPAGMHEGTIQVGELYEVKDDCHSRHGGGYGFNVQCIRQIGNNALIHLVSDDQLPIKW